jgi:hypothetical protein
MPSNQGCCAHDHDCEATDCGASYSLYKHISPSNIRCLNEQLDGSCKNVFRPWSERLSPVSTPLRSNEDDTELLIHVSFDGTVKLKAISVIGGTNGTFPSKMRVFINRDDMDFTTTADVKPVQEWDLQEDQSGNIEYPTVVSKFGGVSCIDIHFTGNFGADFTEIDFIGLKGEFSEGKREAVVAVYETRPVPGDHKVGGMSEGSNWRVG